MDDVVRIVGKSVNSVGEGSAKSFDLEVGVGEFKLRTVGLMVGMEDWTSFGNDSTKGVGNFVGIEDGRNEGLVIGIKSTPGDGRNEDGSTVEIGVDPLGVSVSTMKSDSGLVVRTSSVTGGGEGAPLIT